MTQLHYGENGQFTIEVGEAILAKLAQRTYNHIMTNEAASALKSKRDGWDTEKEGKPLDEPAYLNEWRSKKAAAVQSGEFSIRQSGPRRDPLEVEMEKVTLSRLRKIAQSQGRKLPTKMDGEFVFNEGQPNEVRLTLAEMVARKLAKEHDSIEADAKRIMRERMRAEDNAAKAATGASGTGVEAFGL